MYGNVCVHTLNTTTARQKFQIHILAQSVNGGFSLFFKCSYLALPNNPTSVQYDGHVIVTKASLTCSEYPSRINVTGKLAVRTHG